MRRRWLVWCWASLWVAGAVSAADQAEPDLEALVLAGNDSYQAGDFHEARASYFNVVQQGFESPALYLNLGNAYLQLGELGEAIVAYRRGLLLAPRDGELLANLAYATAQTVDAAPDPGASPLLSWLAALVAGVRPDEAWSAAAVLFWLVVFGWLASRVWPGLRPLRRWVWGGGVPLVVIVTGLAAWRTQVVYGTPEGIVVTEEIDVRSGPATRYKSRFVLHEGTAVDIRRQAGEWLEVALTDELDGWLPAQAVETVVGGEP